MVSSHRLTFSRAPSQKTSSNPWWYTHSQMRARLVARDLSTTPSRRASEDPARNADLQRMFEQQQKLLRLLQDKPEVLENIKSFVKLLQDEGVDVQSGRVPGKMEMLRLLMKPAIRENAMRMAAAFQEAGIDMQSKEMMQSLLAMRDEFGGK